MTAKEITVSRADCPVRHENGNCTPVGGFCTAVNGPVCEAVRAAQDAGTFDANLRTSRALNEAAKLLTGLGYCTHYPGYTCDKGFSTPGVCETCIKEHLLEKGKEEEG